MTGTENSGAGFAGIDPVAMLRLASELRAGEAGLRDEVARVKEICRRLGISDPTPALREAADWMGAKAPELERRVDLAAAVVPGFGPSGGTRWTWVDDTLASAFASPESARAAGAALAARLWEAAEDRGGVPADMLDELLRYGGDPQFAVGLWTRLGPERAARLLGRVERGQRETLAAAPYLGHTDPAWREAYLHRVDALVGALSVSLAAASRVRGEVRSGTGGVARFVELDPERRPVGPDFAAKMTAVDGGWALGQYLGTAGVFDTRFLTRAATEIYDRRMELASRGAYEMATPQVTSGTVAAGESDPLVGALAGLSRNGEAARAWWDEDRMKKILGADKDFPPLPRLSDEGASLGDYLATAATEVRDYSAAGEESAKVAWRAVHYAAQGEIPEGARAGFGTIFASYVDNIGRIAASHRGGNEHDQIFDDVDTVLFTGADTPIGAHFAMGDLLKVMPEVFRDKNARDIVNASMTNYGSVTVQTAVRQRSFDAMHAAESRVGTLFGFMSEAEAKGAVAAGESADQGRKELLDTVGKTLSVFTIPAAMAPGPVGSAIISPTRDRLQGALLKQFETHKAAAAQDEADVRRQDIENELHALFLVAYNDAGMLEGGDGHVDKHASAMKWFESQQQRRPERFPDEDKFFAGDGKIMSPEQMNSRQRHAFDMWMGSIVADKGKPGQSAQNLDTEFTTGSNAWRDD